MSLCQQVQDDGGNGHAPPRLQLERCRVADLPRGEARAVTIQVAALRVTPSAPSHAASARRTGSSALSRRDGASRKIFPNGPTVITTESMASNPPLPTFWS